MRNPRESKTDRTNELEDLFRYPDLKIRQTHGYGGVLARLARRIWLDNNITISTLEQRIRSYVKRINEAHEKGPSDTKPQTPGNIRRQLAKLMMSWRQFLETVKINRATRMEVIVILHYDDAPGGAYSTAHKETVDLNSTDI